MKNSLKLRQINKEHHYNNKENYYCKSKYRRIKKLIQRFNQRFRILIELKRNFHDKEYAIQELERMKQRYEREGQMVKIIEFVTPQEQNLKLQENVRKSALEGVRFSVLIYSNLFLQKNIFV